MNNYQGIRYPLVAICLASIAGCSNNPVNVDLDIEDKNVPNGVLRANKSINSWFSINTEIAHRKGKDRQDIDINGRLNFGNQIINGSESFKHDFELGTGKLIADFTVLNDSRVKLHLGVGLLYSSLSLDTKGSSAGNIDLDENSTDPVVEFRVAVPFSERIEGQLRLSTANTFNVSGSDTRVNDASIEIAYKLTENFNMFAGWYTTSFNNEKYRSDIQIESSGIRYGIGLNF